MLPLPFPYVHNLQCEECYWASDVFVTGDCSLYLMRIAQNVVVNWIGKP